MLLKKFFYHKESLLAEINTKKFLSKNFYAKFLVRSNLLNLNTIKILDTSTKFYNVSEANLGGFLSTQPLDGFSLNARNAVYTNKRNSGLRFESFSCNFSSKFRLLETTYQSFKCLQQSANIQNSLLILKPIKGGFCSYYSGIVGFLPHSHGLMVVRKLLFLSTKPQVEAEKNNFYYLLSQEKFTDKYFISRFPFDLGQAVIYSKFKKNNFSSTSRKKKDFSTKYNFVFLLKNTCKSTSHASNT
jgi:hypothetical protein